MRILNSTDSFLKSLNSCIAYTFKHRIFLIYWFRIYALPYKGPSEWLICILRVINKLFCTDAFFCWINELWARQRFPSKEIIWDSQWRRQAHNWKYWPSNKSRAYQKITLCIPWCALAEKNCGNGHEKFRSAIPSVLLLLWTSFCKMANTYQNTPEINAKNPPI